MAYSGPSGAENIYYATPNFEIVATSAGTDYRHYLYAAGSSKLVISRTTAGAVNVRSLLTNHQGSISSIIANSTGAKVVSESFTAYGNRREASTWSGAPTSGELNTMNGITREGYTFQTVHRIGLRQPTSLWSWIISLSRVLMYGLVAVQHVREYQFRLACASIQYLHGVGVGSPAR